MACREAGEGVDMREVCRNGKSSVRQHGARASATRSTALRISLLNLLVHP